MCPIQEFKGNCSFSFSWRRRNISESKILDGKSENHAGKKPYSCCRLQAGRKGPRTRNNLAKKISAIISLVKLTQERNYRGSDQYTADCKQEIKGPKTRNVLTKKISAIISGACGGSRRKAQEMCVYISDEARECMEEKEHELASNKSSETQDNATKRKKKYGEAAIPHLTVAPRISGIFRKRTSFNLRKWKTIKTGYANANDTKCLGLRPLYGRITWAQLRLKREVRWGEKMTWDARKALEAEEADGELELCKKRILLGEKCIPLILSGALHYDKEGILLPEDFLQSEDS